MVYCKHRKGADKKGKKMKAYNHTNTHGKQFTIEYREPRTRNSRMGYAYETGDDYVLYQMRDGKKDLVSDGFASIEAAQAWSEKIWW